MKKICIFCILLCASQNTFAGLFEYNVVENPSAGVERQILLPGGSSSSVNSNSTSTPRVSPTSPASNYFQPYNYSTNSISSSRPYYEDIRAQNGYYTYTELKRELEAELKRLERRAEDIDDIKRDLVLDIRRYKSYSTSRYHDIRRQLEDDLDHLENEEKYTEDMIDDLEDEIKDLRKNKNTKAYYYYDGRHYNNTNYSNNSTYYNNSNSHRSSYSIYNKGYYYYDENFGYTYKPAWVNPNLNPGLEREIYIR